MYIKDPIELMEDRIERMVDEYIDDSTCMQCKKKVDYELFCMSPMGDGPLLCQECAGLTDADLEKITGDIRQLKTKE